MFDLVPVDHDPFADPPVKLIPVDHDPFAVGPVAQPADPAMAGAAAPQLVPVDHDPFAAAPTGALPRIIVHPISPNAPPDNPAGADGPDDWFVPTADGYPDDWFVPAPLSTPGPGQSGPNAQSNAAVPPLSNPPTVRPDPSAAYWSLIPASRAGAFAWHPPIFPNSAGQFPQPAPAYDPPILPVGGLFGGIGRKLAASVNGPGTGYGLFGGPVRLPAVNTGAAPSILGDVAPLSYTAQTFASNSAPSSIYPPYLGGSALPSHLIDPTTPLNQSFFTPLAQFPDPTAGGAFPLGSWSSPSAFPFQAPATTALPTRSILFKQAPAAWDPSAPDRNAANLDQTARTLGVSDLPLSKSGAPVVSSPPQLTPTRQQWLDVAHLVSPNLVDYLTKTLPPAPPLPSTPGKIPSEDNPYATGAVSEIAAWLLTLLSAGAAAPLGIAPVAEEAALQGTRTALGAPALIGGNLSREASGRIVAALQAAVNAGSLTREQAAVLLQRANGVGEAGGARLETPLSRWLPKYDGTTYGLLITNEGRVVPLQSGPPRSFTRYPPSKHAEGKGAIWIRENGSSGGVLYHNNPEGTCGLCDRQLRTLLPSKAVLDVVPPPDAVPKNALAVTKPKPYIGNDIVPNPLPKIRQPDLFGNQP
jgi:hypothetical protein